MAPSATRWWIGGRQECTFCGGRYAYQMEIRCVDCDRPICPVCAVWVYTESRSHYCPECSPAGGSGAGPDRPDDSGGG